MRKTFTLITLMLIAVSSIKADEVKSETAKDIIPQITLKNDIYIKFGGWVRAEYYIDNREMAGALEGLFGFFPLDKNIGADGKDLNKVIRQNLSTQATRFNALIKGPDLGKSRTSAYFEFDFTGGNNINLRLRHAWVKFNWTKTELLIGRFWNPMGLTPFPDVAGLHTGIPFRPFGRAEQIRVSHNLTDRFSVLLAGVYQSEHKSFIESGTDMRANPYPDMHLQFHYKTPSFQTGLMSELKTIRPATQTTGENGGQYKATSTITSYAFSAYANIDCSKFNAKASVLYGQNLSEMFMQGGYAVKSYDPETGNRKYTPSNAVTAWANVSYGKIWKICLFGGYMKNLGFTDNILQENGAFYGRWQNIDHVYRIAPSLIFSYKQWLFQAEVDYDIAAYGTVDYQDKGKVKDAHDVTGVRGILATTFFF